MTESAGEEFQRATRYRRSELRGHTLDWDAKPATFKLYPQAPVVPLPPPERASWPGADIRPEESLWYTLDRRRSVRQFVPDALEPADLSQLLWAANGITRPTPHHLFRTAPSAGGLYPIETYVVVNAVAGLEAGLYHYRLVGMADDGSLDPDRGHALERLALGDFGAHAARAALDQSMVARAPVTFVWTAVFPRSRWKYRERAFRYVYLDAGHIAAHLSLAAVALGLGSCQVAAFFDDELNALLGVDGEEESAVYLTVVGRPREGGA